MIGTHYAGIWPATPGAEAGVAPPRRSAKLRTKAGARPENQERIRASIAPGLGMAVRRGRRKSPGKPRAVALAPAPPSTNEDPLTCKETPVPLPLQREKDRPRSPARKARSASPAWSGGTSSKGGSSRGGDAGLDSPELKRRRKDGRGRGQANPKSLTPAAPQTPVEDHIPMLGEVLPFLPPRWVTPEQLERFDRECATALE